MKFFQKKLLVVIFLGLVITGVIFYYKDDVSRFLKEALIQPPPCQRVITYSIADLDPRFNLTKEELLSVIKQAEEIWESSIDKQLFAYSPTGDLKISLIYDYRQEATDAMRKIGIVINNDRDTYEALKAKYDSLVKFYDVEKARVDMLVATYEKTKATLEKDIEYWNSHGGVPRSEQNSINKRIADLNSQIVAINQAGSSLNKIADDINSAVVILNRLIAELNLQVSTYNAVGKSTGEEFKAGEYVSNTNGTAISIFQFDNKSQLLRVLAHEFGHALGLGHLDNPNAIMYYLNEGINDKLTTDDASALRDLCGGN